MKRVWIVFGDTDRSDGDNIWGVFSSEPAAIKQAELLTRYNKRLYTIESFELED